MMASDDRGHRHTVTQNQALEQIAKVLAKEEQKKQQLHTTCFSVFPQTRNFQIQIRLYSALMASQPGSTFLLGLQRQWLMKWPTRICAPTRNNAVMSSQRNRTRQVPPQQA